MVYGWNEEKKLVEILRLPRTKHMKAVRLFHYDEHYSVVRSMSALTNTDHKNNKYYFCSYCLYKHRSAESLESHMKDCTVNELTEVKMPKKREYVGFKTGNLRYASRTLFTRILKAG